MKVYQLVLDNCGDGYLYGPAFATYELAEAYLPKFAKNCYADVEDLFIKSLDVVTKLPGESDS